MKKLVCITGVILIVCVCVSTFFSPEISAEVQADIKNDVTIDTESTYIIKAENNKIVVYRKGESVPFIVTDVLTGSLPRGDIRLLKEGIEVKGDIKLKKSLEDYCS